MTELSQVEILIRLIVALVLGGLVGLERELKSSPAGMRTHTLVALGSSLFTLMSIKMAGPGVDVSRIAAQVVVGIGFLGGGTIFKSENRVIGLTTAATLWVTAAIGLVVGVGDFFTAVTATSLVLAVIVMGRWFEKVMLHKRKK